MNIAIFASAYHPHFGGVEEACRNLAAEYSKRGHGVDILTTRHPSTLPEHEIIDGINVWRFSFVMPRTSPRGMLDFLRSFGHDRRKVIDVLKRRKSTLIHVQCVGPNGLYALAAASGTGLPIVVTTQGERTMDAGRLYQKSIAANWTLRRLLRVSKYVTACSNQTLTDAKQYAGFSIEKKSQAIYNGIDLKEFDRTTEAYAHPVPYILGIGRIVPQKGFDILIEAYRTLRGTVDNPPDLILAGDGPERANLQALVDRHQMQKYVHFIGHADRSCAVSLFHGCTLFVLPSRHEPQGIVTLEAMACAKPVIAANVGGVPEIVNNGETGVLFTGENISELASSMYRVLTDSDLASQLGSAGRVRVESLFTWEKIADQYFEVYDVATRSSQAPSSALA